jgi:hypothetical protein
MLALWEYFWDASGWAGLVVNYLTDAGYTFVTRTVGALKGLAHI